MALELNDANIGELLANKEITMIDFYATWCGPCRILGPVVDKLSNENTDDTIGIGKVNIEENKESAAKYSIRNLPTILFFKGDEVVDRLVGVQRIEALKAKLESLTTNNETDNESEG